jgi:AcrR family transcriptional regulator
MSPCSDFGHSRLPVKKTAKKMAAGGRRRPVQGRSQATVEALLEAAAQILARHGAEAATTNAIAERAGVSIGSLYQYFADREALVDELTARHIAQMQAVMLGVLQEPEARAIREQAVRIVRAILAAHRVNPRLHQALHQLLPVRGMSAIDRFEAHMEQVVEALLVAREAHAGDGGAHRRGAGADHRRAGAHLAAARPGALRGPGGRAGAGADDRRLRDRGARGRRRGGVSGDARAAAVAWAAGRHLARGTGQARACSRAWTSAAMLARPASSSGLLAAWAARASSWRRAAAAWGE